MNREQHEIALSAAIKAVEVNDTGEAVAVNKGEWSIKELNKENVIDKWIPRGSTMKESFPITSNGFEPSEGSEPRGTMVKDGIGFFQGFPSNIHQSEKYLNLLTMASYRGNGCGLDSNNIIHGCVAFSVRKVCYARFEREGVIWARGKDVFPSPTLEFQDSDEWDSFATDCVVYSLFSHGANQTALRDYEYGTEADGSPKLWRVENQFYWGSREHVKELAQENNAEEVIEDLEGDTGERYVHKHLEGKTLSPEAQLLLDKANAILDTSFQYRVPFYYDSPLYCTIAWDMGWLQIQRMCFGRDSLPAAKADDELQALYGEFKVAREALGEKIATRYSEDTGF